jgi:uncharacterized protein (UPF0305 family)
MFHLFQLSAEEWEVLRLQIETSKRGGRRYLPYAFTEQGFAMLSGLLGSVFAIEMNISIMRAFVAIRQTLLLQPKIADNQLQAELKALKDYIEDVFADYNDINEDTRTQLELINQSLAELQNSRKQTDKARNKIGFVKD